jgi:hypothetical protein
LHDQVSLQVTGAERDPVQSIHAIELRWKDLIARESQYRSTQQSLAAG